MLPQQVIRKKRDGGTLAAEEIAAFVRGATDGSVSEGQIGAFTMAVFLRGMTRDEIVALTLAMRDSGRVLDWRPSGIEPRLIIEKHSTGGVGDEKMTLLVVPIAAACGLYVPNLSARGLDYCPGEVDMLDSVPGYRTAPTAEDFMRVVREAGGAVIGPTADLAPADRKFFFVRDVTATVESVPLITGSILSKKLAAAPTGMVISVGAGSGAFMHDVEQARAMATSLAEVGAGAGIPTVTLVTDMDAVLGTAVGSAVEMIETVAFLAGRHRDGRVLELALAIVAEMLVLGRVVADVDEGRKIALARLADGSAAERFGRMIHGLGGPVDFVAHPEKHLAAAPVIRAVHPETEGILSGMDAQQVGFTLVELGGGRTRPDQEIDFAVGMTGFAQRGDRIGVNRPICIVHARDEADWERAARRLRAAMRIGGTAPAPRPMVIERIERRP